MDETKDKLLHDPDFILSRRHGNSIAKLLQEDSGELSVAAAGKLLGLSEEEADAMNQRIVARLRKQIAPDFDPRSTS